MLRAVLRIHRANLLRLLASFRSNSNPARTSAEAAVRIKPTSWMARKRVAAVGDRPFSRAYCSEMRSSKRAQRRSNADCSAGDSS
jgi:hypothetical protein